MFYRHIHSFRAIAIAGVVAEFCLSSVTWNDKHLAVYAIGSLVAGSGIWFAFIAGFLFQHLSPRFEISRYYGRKIRNVIVPYLIMSIPALIVVTGVSQLSSMPAAFYDVPVWKQVVLLLATGKQLEPFWFVPALALLYVAAPLFIRVDRARWPYLLLVPAIAASMILGRDGFQDLMGGGLLWAPVSAAVYLLAPYMVGMFCSRHHERILRMSAEEVNLLFAMAAVAYALNVHYLNSSDAHAALFVFKLVSSPLLVYATYRMSGRVAGKLAPIATYSFGIYLLHGYVIDMSKFAASNSVVGTVLGHGGAVVHALLTAIVILGCYWILTTAKQILGPSSRMVTGC